MKAPRRRASCEQTAFLAAAALALFVGLRFALNVGTPSLPGQPVSRIPLVRIADSSDVIHRDSIQRLLKIAGIERSSSPIKVVRSDKTDRRATQQDQPKHDHGDAGNKHADLPDRDRPHEDAKVPPVEVFPYDFCGIVQAGGRRTIILKDKTGAIRHGYEGDTIGKLTIESITPNWAILVDPDGKKRYRVSDPFFRLHGMPIHSEIARH
jgi:hypothetical protein